MTHRSALVRGAIGGVLAATAVALFFLVADVLRGELLETPAFLASVLLGRDEVERGLPLLAVYTVLHYAVFVVVGISLAWVLDRARVPATLFLGLVLGFLLFDIVFYASIGLTGVDVARTLGWPTFLAGNLVAGLVLVLYLGRTGPSPARRWRDVLREHRVLREGIVAGLLGAAAVAVWFFLVDLVLGRVFFTPAALGSAVFYGANEVGLVQVTAATVLGYTAIHVVAFLVTGLVFAAVVGQADRHPPVLLALALLFVTFETLAIGVITIIAQWLLDIVPWWTIAVGNLIAAGVMGVYLWKRHPGLARDLDRAEAPERAGSGAGGGPTAPFGGPGPRA